jgi:hypothetical protein
MGLIGASHTYFFNPTFSQKVVVLASGSEQPAQVDSIIRPQMTIFRNYEGNFIVQRSTINYSVNKKFNSKNTVQAGINVDRIGFELKDKFNTSSTNISFQDIRNNEGANYLTQMWIQWQHKFTERFMVNSGLHGQWFSINNKSITVEPRLGIRYQLTEKLALNGGAGVHNQTQPIFMYYNKNAAGETTNKNLGFTTSYHGVAGFDYNFASDWRIKVETYYQALNNIPVESSPSTFSMVNVGADFNLPGNTNLVNNGTGHNYGVEFTFEKFFSNGFYLLQTTSLFESKYKGSDGIERNTAFNGNYVTNLLGGYELKLGKKHTLSIDLKGTLAGGRRITPIDESQSLLQKRTIRFEDLAYTEQLPAYFRMDVRVGFKREGKRISQQWMIQFNNVTDQKNIFLRRYSQLESKIVDVPQLPFQVIPQYRILF